MAHSAPSQSSPPLDGAVRPAPAPRPVVAEVEAPAAPERRPASSRWRRMLGAVEAYPMFRRLWFGALSASLGQWMQQIALGWLALVKTDSPAFVGLVGLMAGLPFLVVALPGGVLIDRVDRKQLLLRCQLIATVLALIVAVVVIADWVEPWHLLVVAFVTGSIQALLNPTQQSLVPALVGRADLTNALGLMSAGQNMTRVAGPSIAGLMIAVAGVGPTFLLQALALIGAFSLVWRIKVPARPPATTAGRGVFEGVRLISQRSDLRSLFLLASIPTLFVFPYIQFLPVFARDVLDIGAGGLGVLMAASGSGAVVGSLVTATRRQTRGAGRFILMLTVSYGVVIVGMALSRSVWLSLPLLFVAGLVGATFMSTNNVLIQTRITDDVRGRVMGAYLLTFGLMPLGAMPMGLAANRWGAPTAVAVGAVLSSTLAAIVGLLSRELREV